jgi:hypothetical protein
MVKKLECAEGLRFSMTEIEDKRNHMGRGSWPTLPRLVNQELLAAE